MLMDRRRRNADIPKITGETGGGEMEVEEQRADLFGGVETAVVTST